MKKVLIILLIVMFIVTPCYALNIFDRMLYKEVVLRANSKHVLVNRVTNHVKYMLQFNGDWTPVTGGMQGQLQAMYEYQCALQGK